MTVPTTLRLSVVCGRCPKSRPVSGFPFRRGRTVRSIRDRYAIWGIDSDVHRSLTVSDTHTNETVRAEGARELR